MSSFLQNQVIVNQLKRQGEEINQLGESLETKTASEAKLERQVREAQRKYADLETRMKEDLMMARIRDAENTQCVAELTQKISSLEYKVTFVLKKSKKTFPPSHTFFLMLKKMLRRIITIVKMVVEFHMLFGRWNSNYFYIHVTILKQLFNF